MPDGVVVDRVEDRGDLVVAPLHSPAASFVGALGKAGSAVASSDRSALRAVASTTWLTADAGASSGWRRRVLVSALRSSVSVLRTFARYTASSSMLGS